LFYLENNNIVIIQSKNVNTSNTRWQLFQLHMHKKSLSLFIRIVYVYMRARARARACVCVCVCVFVFGVYAHPNNINVREFSIYMRIQEDVLQSKGILYNRKCRIKDLH